MPNWAPGYILGCYAFGFEPAMTAMIQDPELFVYVCDRHAARDGLRMQRLAAAGAEAVFVADSWASCDIISPALFERFALPYQRSVTQAVHAAGMRMILWNLGDIVPVLGLEASLDLEGFAFEQPRKTFAVSIAQVRRVFGPQRCLFGNLDSEDLLLRNDAGEIASEVVEQIRQAGPAAPFILCTGSPIPSNVEPEAVDAMIRAARGAVGP
jgi:uroporphyrinogen decarboxylase